MAGIGFSLRALGASGGITGKTRLYGAAGVIGSGPWLISIITILLAGVISVDRVPNAAMVPQFQVSVTYLFAGSLVLTGPLQLLFTRFIADRMFEDRNECIVPNLFGAMVVVSAVAGALGGAVVALWFSGQSVLYRVLMVESFVVLCDLWLVIVLLTGLKCYGAVLRAFALAYGLILGSTWLLAPYGLGGLMAGFTAGQALLLFACLRLILRDHAGAARGSLIAFEFLRGDLIFPSLAVTGLLFNVGIWIDKVLFWANPMTSEAVIGPLRASYLYDVPIFLAYLSAVPGMAVFLVRLETDFAEHYSAFYSAVRDGASLSEIERLRDQMTVAARRGIVEILKIQGVTLLFIVIAAPGVLALFGISELFLPLLYVDAAAVGIQVLLLAILNVFFYLDQRKTALRICVLFVAINTVATLITQKLGYLWFGYGFALAVLTAALVGLALLNRRFDHLVRDTFMMQGVEA